MLVCFAPAIVAAAVAVREFSRRRADGGENRDPERAPSPTAMVVVLCVSLLLLGAVTFAMIEIAIFVGEGEGFRDPGQAQGFD